MIGSRGVQGTIRSRYVASHISSKLGKEGIPKVVVFDILDCALEYDGVYDLLVLWDKEEEEQERIEIVDAILELVSDINT